MILLVPLTFLATVWAASFVTWPWWLAGMPTAAAALCLMAARRPWHVAIGLALAALALGLLRSAAGAAPPSPLAQALAGEQVVALRGAVAGDPIPRGRVQQAILRVDALESAGEGWRATRGTAQVTIPLVAAWQDGEVVEVRGTVQTPEESATAGYAAYLRRQQIDATVAFPATKVLGYEAPHRLSHALSTLRHRLAEPLATYLPEPEAALVAGILLGVRASIPRDLTDAFNRSGTSHLIAISGFNVSMVVGAVALLLGRPGRRPGARRVATAALCSLALWGFVALVGASGSVLRAAAMAQLALLGRAAGRQGTAGSLLLWGSAALAAWQPDIVADASWQLSFLGTAGLIWLAGPLAAGLGRLGRLPAFAVEALAATLAAQLFILPVLVSTFGRVSLIAPLPNVLSLPLVAPIMAGGTALALSGTLFPPAAPLLASLTWAPAAALVALVRWSAGLPHAAAPLPAWPPAAITAYLAALVVLCAVVEWRTQGQIRSPSAPPPSAGGLGGRARAALLSGLLALAAVAWAMAFPAGAFQAPRLVARFPAVPDGTLAFVQAPDGSRVLVNGGPAANSAVALLGEHLRPWDRTIDAIVLADPRQASIQGLAMVLERYRTGVLIDLVDDYPSATYRHLRSMAAQAGVRRLVVAPGTRLTIGRSLTLDILGPPEPEPGGEAHGSPALSALRLRWGEFSLLVPAGPLRSSALHDLPASTVVLLGDRESQTPVAAALLAAARPEVVVVQDVPRPSTQRAPGSDGETDPLDVLPEAARYRTAVDGPLTIEATTTSYRLVRR